MILTLKSHDWKRPRLVIIAYLFILCLNRDIQMRKISRIRLWRCSERDVGKDKENGCKVGNQTRFTMSTSASLCDFIFIPNLPLEIVPCPDMTRKGT